MRDFRKLQVWNKAHQLALSIYQTTRTYPHEELYGLVSQTWRACVSIPANIAEGCGRGTVRELDRILRIASGSASELEYHLLLGRDLTFLPNSQHVDLNYRVCEVKQMLTSFIQKLRENPK
jgi:four helix bundle protein